MSFLSDFFAATVEEEEALDLGAGPGASAVHAKAVDPVKLVRLEEILTGAPYELIAQDSFAGYVRRRDDTDNVVLGVRPSLVTALAELAPGAAAETASRWAETEEWRLDRARPEDLEPLLRELSDLARSAGASGRRLFLWLAI